jgi:ArsR family transcriptional regulator, arsenate/arsenite/antimonite-responsive transcriptional repressor
MQTVTAHLEQVFRALADRTRLRIVSLLRDGPLCVGDLVTVLGVSQPMVSRHLAYLRKSRLVDDERRGQWSFYRLAPGPNGLPGHILGCIDAAARGDELRRDAAALTRLQRKGGCCPSHTQRKATS